MEWTMKSGGLREGAKLCLAHRGHQATTRRAGPDAKRYRGERSAVGSVQDRTNPTAASKTAKAMRMASRGIHEDENRRMVSNAVRASRGSARTWRTRGPRMKSWIAVAQRSTRTSESLATKIGGQRSGSPRERFCRPSSKGPVNKRMATELQTTIRNRRAVVTKSCLTSGAPCIPR